MATPLIETIDSALRLIVAAKKGDPEGEDVPLTLAELIVIEDALKLFRKVAGAQNTGN